jgi:murein DD-endopeptidase MepM/ murein hydrolase activator NlpD
MKQLLRKMSSAELQELVDLIAGCTCSNVTNKSENEEATGENLVQSDVKDYFNIVIFNFETLNKSVKEYKESIKDYILEKEQEFSETFAELSSLREKESKGYGVEKNTIDKLNKQVNDLAQIIKDKSAGASKSTPGSRLPTPGGKPGTPKPPTSGGKPGTPKPPGAGRGVRPAPAKPTPSGKPPTSSTAGKITTGAGVLTAAGVFVTSKFNPARTIDGVTRPHEGTDLRARTPKPLYSIKSGKVTFAGRKKGYGNYVMVEHDDVISAYAHLSEIKVKVGQSVSQGQLIGLSGKTGTKDAHLHFEIRKKDKGDGVGGKPGLGTPINPESYFKENPDVHSPLVNKATLTANKSTVTKPQNNLIETIAKTIRTKESGTPQGDYTIENKQGSSGSGAYQFLDGTWQGLTQSYGIGTEYDRAKDAPREIQDAVAYRRIEEILKLSRGDVSKVPVAWYTGNIKGKSKDVSPQVVTAYQKEWMGILGSNMPEKRSTTAAVNNPSTKLGKQEKTRTVILPVILGYK